MDIGLSDAETLIMEVIWSQSKPISAAEIQEKLHEKNWKIQTVNTLLKRLLKHEVISFEKVKSSKTYAYYYAPTLTREQYKGIQSREFLNSVHKGSLYSFVSALVQEESVSDADLIRARKWLEEWRGGKDGD